MKNKRAPHSITRDCSFITRQTTLDSRVSNHRTVFSSPKTCHSSQGSIKRKQAGLWVATPGAEGSRDVSKDQDGICSFLTTHVSSYSSKGMGSGTGREPCGFGARQYGRGNSGCKRRTGKYCHRDNDHHDGRSCRFLSLQQSSSWYLQGD